MSGNDVSSNLLEAKNFTYHMREENKHSFSLLGAENFSAIAKWLLSSLIKHCQIDKP